MTNQALLWALFIGPWLSLFFMPREDIKRWMPAALFTALSLTFIADVGFTLQMWEVRENIFPLHDQMPPAYGLLPITTMWILKFTYGRFWLYALVEVILSLIFAYLLQPWFSDRGIWVWIYATPLTALLPAFPHFISIYLYQMWQEGIFSLHETANSPTILQPSAAKPLPESQNQDKESKDD